jgi:hypothetical protein
MRNSHLFAILGLIASANLALAEQPIAAIQPPPPTLMMASATTCCDSVTLRIQTVQFVPATQEMKVKVPITEVKWEKGRQVEHTRMVEQRQLVTVNKAVPAAVVELPLDGAAVCVFELNGKPVAPKKVSQMLKKETAVLVSFGGPVDPFYLQTTKSGTLIVQVPANLLNPAATSPGAPIELLPSNPPVPGPNEPPLAPPTPKKN